MEIYLRFASNTSYLPNLFLTKAYDCRMLFILKGSGKIQLANESFELRENSFCYYPTGTSYFPLSSTKNTLKFITLNFDFDKRYPQSFKIPSTVAEEKFFPKHALMSHMGDIPEIFKKHFVLQNAYDLRNTFLEIEQDFNRNERYGKEKAAAKLQYLCYCLPTYTTNTNCNLLQKMLTYINNHLCTMQSNEELAQALNYHSYYLNKIFKAQTGTTIHQYILKNRLEKSVQLLHDTDLSITEIATRCGFDDQRHFSTLFAKKIGYSPMQERKYGSRLL